MQEHGAWRAEWTIKQYWGEPFGEPDRIVVIPGNLLVNAGILLTLGRLRGDSLTAFSNANARLGVGDSTTAAVATQTDLQASSNFLRKAMDATFPKVGVADGLADNQIQFQSTFGSSEANFAWNEFGAFNAASTGTMLNRKQSAQGTKASGATWVLILTITIT